MLSYRYTLRETGQNLRRNVGLALATVITTGVSLAMFGGFSLFQAAINSATQRWADGIEFVVWMNADATPEATRYIRSLLEESPEVASWTYKDQEETYEEFKEIAAGNEEILEIVKQEILPPSYRVTPFSSDVDVVQELGKQFEGQPGVRTITFAGEAIRDVQNLASRAGNVLFSGSIILLVASMLLILNTLAIAINNRKQEIEIMRVVGATKWFIRLPFMLEGLVQGMLGAAIAIACNILLRTHVIDRFGQADAIKLLAGFKVNNAAMLRTNLTVLAIAALVSVIGSGLAVSIHLDKDS